MTRENFQLRLSFEIEPSKVGGNVFFGSTKFKSCTWEAEGGRDGRPREAEREAEGGRGSQLILRFVSPAEHRWSHNRIFSCDFDRWDLVPGE